MTDTSETNNNTVGGIISYLKETATSSRGISRVEEQEPPTSLLQALIIGIDIYASDRIRPLQGAVADADDVYHYLRSELKVPEEQIVNLRNEGATREAILCHIRGLSARHRLVRAGGSDPVSRDDPFLIYFAGHGTSAEAPKNWVTETNKISMLVPYDGGDDAQGATRNIPDLTIGALLHELAEGKEDDGNGKGNNITVILDCCYSGSGTRQSELLSERLERGFELAAGIVIPSTLDQDVWGVVYADRASKLPAGFAQFGTKSHVLLAACGETEKAYEGYRHGMFTRVLLEELRKVKTDKITYRELIRRIIISKQTPQCEGYHSDRVLFNALAPSTGRTVYEVSQKNDKYILLAGSLHGVTEGAQFSIYLSRDFLADSPVMATMQAKGVGAFNTELHCTSEAVLPGPLPSPCFAFQTTMGAAEALCLHITPADSDELMPVFTALAEEMQPYHRAETPSILLGNEAQSHLSVRTSQRGFGFRIRDSLIASYGLTQLSQLVPPEEHRVHIVLRAASRFFWHLRREPHQHSLRKNVHVSLHRVKKDPSGALGNDLRPVLVADGGNLIHSDAVEVVADDESPYGMTVCNDWGAQLHVWAFYFDCSDLSISEYYRSPESDPKARGEASLPANGRLPIGHGSGGVAPFKYFLRPGELSQNLDVGFIKVFISTERSDLSDVAQPSPFEYKEHRGSGSVVFPPEATWDTVLIAVVQRPPTLNTEE